MHSLTHEYLTALRFNGTLAATFRTLGGCQSRQQLYAVQVPKATPDRRGRVHRIVQPAGKCCSNALAVEVSGHPQRNANQRTLSHFEQEVQKLEAWANDLKLGLAQDIKEIDREINEVGRTAATSPMLEEKLVHQKRQRELEIKRSKMRRELFARQDDIEAQRNTLIEKLEEQLEKRVQEQVLFNVEWILR